MEQSYYDKSGRKQWRTICDNCGALLGDTAPMQNHIPRDVAISNICPKCGGHINTNNSTSNNK